MCSFLFVLHTYVTGTMGITIIMYQDTELKFDSYNFNTTHPHTNYALAGHIEKNHWCIDHCCFEVLAIWYRGGVVAFKC